MNMESLTKRDSIRLVEVRTGVLALAYGLSVLGSLRLNETDWTLCTHCRQQNMETLIPQLEVTWVRRMRNVWIKKVDGILGPLYSKRSR